MNVKWHIGPRGPRDRIENQFQNYILRLPILDRIDVVLVAGISCTLIMLVMITVLVVDFGYHKGWFDKPILKQLDDPRKLENVRDGLDRQPLLDAVYHQPEGKLYLSQTGGLIHTYDPATGLWSTSSPLQYEPVSQDIVQLRSGCGADPLSVHVKDCPDPNSLWLLGSDGSLARKRGIQWQTILGNTFFVGANGSLVNSDELVAASISEDGRWLVLGTLSNGLGLYDIEKSSWLNIDPLEMDNLPSKKITRLLFWKDLFWIGTDAGLASAKISQGRVEVQNRLLDGNILELEAEPKRLWVLAERNCVQEGTGCLWLGQYDSPKNEPLTIIDEKNRYDRLDFASLNFADFWNEQLVLAGEAGIYQYDPLYHSWDQLFNNPVNEILTSTEKAGFYFSFPGGVARLTQDLKIQPTWPITGETIIKLEETDQDVLALTAAGDAWSLTADGNVLQAFYRGRTLLDPESFTTAYSVGDNVLFIGADGAMLHNTALRTYRDISKTAIPDWMEDPGTQYLNAEGYVFAMEPGNGRTVVHALPNDGAVDATYFTGGDIRDLGIINIPFQSQSIWPWKARGVGIVTEDGRLVLVNKNAYSLEIGRDSPMAVADFKDVAQINGFFLATDGKSLASYDLSDRSWGRENAPALAENESFLELASYGNRLFLRTSEGRLLRHPEDTLVEIGLDADFSIKDADLTDAVEKNDQYYLAGAGRVELYNANSRTIEKRWDIQGDGPVSIEEILNGQPLALCDGTLSLGNTALFPEDGAVLSASVDNQYIWTVRQAGDIRYLQGQDVNAPGNRAQVRCFFRQPSIENYGRITDVRLLPNGGIAVATQNGLRIYSSEARSWYQVEPDPLPNGGRIYHMESDSNPLLLFVGPGSDNLYTLQYVPPESIIMPDTCSTLPATLNIVNSVTAIGYDVDEQHGRVAWIDQNGGVWENDSTTRQVLSPIHQSPNSSEILRVYDRSDTLLFTTVNGLWRYYVDRRTWDFISLAFPDGTGPITDINIEQSGDTELVTAASGDGSFYMGELEEDDSSVGMSLLYQGGQAFFNADAADLVDVQERGSGAGQWTFVLNDKIQYYDPSDRIWKRSELFNLSGPSFQNADGRGVIVGNGGQTWWVASSTGPYPIDFNEYSRTESDVVVALDSRGAIWRLLEDGGVALCEPGNNIYACKLSQSPAFLLDPDTVLRAFEWNSKVLFITTKGLRAYDLESRSEIPLGSDALVVYGLANIHEWKDHLFLFNNNTLLMLDKELRITTRIGVDNLMFDSSGKPWAEFDGVLHFYQDENWISASNYAPEGSNFRIYMLDGSTPTGLDEDGFVYYWSGSNFEPIDLQIPEVLPVLDGLIRSSNWEFWAIAQDHLFRIRQGQCGGEEIQKKAGPHKVIPCLQVLGQIKLPLGQVVYAAPYQSGQIFLRDANGTTAMVNREQDGNYAIRLGIDSPNPTIEDLDRWPEFIRYVAVLANGETAFNPITELALGSGNRLVARYSSGDELTLADSAVIAQSLDEPFDLPAALDIGWLKWDRDSTSFQVRSATGVVNMTRNQLIRDRKFVFENISAVLPAGAPLGKLYAATPFGVWAFTGHHVDLADRSIVYYPPEIDTFSINTASHGRFLSTDHAVVVGPSGLQTSNFQLPPIQLGQVVFQQLDPTKVEVTISSGSFELPGFSSKGFSWDENRRSLAYEGDDLLLQSDAGILNTRQLTNFDSGPDDLALRGGKIRSDGQGQLYVSSGDTWYRRDDGRWQKNVANPAENRDLFQTPYWEWSIKNGQLSTTMKENVFNFQLVQTTQSLGFTSDQMLSAAAFNGKLYVATQAFLEIADNSNALSNFSAPRQGPVNTDRFETIRFSDGRQELFSYGGLEVFRWNSQPGVFSPIPNEQNPEVKRVLIDNDRLRFTWERNRVSKELRIETITGEERWMPFGWVRGRFPFDYVTAVTSFDNKLYVGTAGGLTIYESPDDLALDRFELLDARAGPVDSLAGIKRTGVPLDQLDRLIVLTDSDCIEQRYGLPFTVCTTRKTMDDELKISTNFWQWSKTATGQLVGKYVTNTGQPDSTTIDLLDNRWPNDDLLDATLCDGRFVELWRNGWITVHSDATTALKVDTVNYPPMTSDAERLICVPNTISVSDRDLTPGVYLEGMNDQMWSFAGTSWNKITEQLTIHDLQVYGEAPPIYYRNRLRLLAASDRGFEFEQRSLDGRWQPLRWSQAGRIEIDEWYELVYSSNTLWAATPAGLVNFQRSTDQKIIAKPDSLLVIREPLAGGSPCLATDLRATGADVLARCNYLSDQVYESVVLSNRDSGVFKRMTGNDPFAEYSYIQAGETGYWSFSLAGRANGNQGYLEGSLELNGLKEPIQLNNGRFLFDTINSLAAFQEGWVEIATDSAGWYRAPSADSLHIKDLTRSPIAQDVDHVNWTGLSGFGENRMLCLQSQTSTEAVLLDSDFAEQSRTEGCAEYQGSDTFWLYQRNKGKLEIIATESKGGLGRRELISGRFSNEIAVGIPATRYSEEEITYLVPTTAGVMEYNKELEIINLYAGPFNGLPEDQVPSALYMIDQRNPTYLANGKLYELEDARAESDLVLGGSSWGAGVNALGTGPLEFIQIDQEQSGVHLWSYVTPGGVPFAMNAIFVDVSGFDKYLDNVQKWGAIQPQLTAFLPQGKFYFSFGDEQSHELELPEGFELIDAIQYDKKIILIGRRELLEFNLESAMVWSMENRQD